MPKKPIKKPTKHTLILKLDKIFSEVVRSIGWCERCHTKEKQLQCAHIYSRRYRHTRWDTENAICLCAGCHFRAHQNPIDFSRWVEDYLGKGTLDELRVKAHDLGSMTLDEMQETYKILLEVKSRG
jgi:hypothetical protein